MGRILAALAVALTVAVVTAAPAAATPEDDYLGVLAGTPGFTVNGFTGPMLTGAGHQICGDLRGGMTAEASAQKMLYYPGSSLALTRVMVSAAQQTLCPDTLPGQ